MNKLLGAFVAFFLGASICHAQSVTSIPAFDFVIPHGGEHGANGFTLNAANENGQVVGTIFMQGGSGTKTISAGGGGSIFIWAGSSTWATASSELRVGIEDLSSAGIGDTTQDVYGAKIAGTDSIVAPHLINWDMTSGTKTLTHGDPIAISTRMPVRAGADSVAFGTWTWTPGYAGTGRPYGVANSAKTSEMLYAVIKFDDGTYGWIQGAQNIQAPAATVTYGNASTPDEYIATFTVSVPIQISRIGQPIDDAAAADLYDLNLFTDPYGTPTAVRTVNVDPDAFTNEGATPMFIFTDIAVYTLIPGVTYGIGQRPSTANTITMGYINVETGFEGLKATLPLVENVKLASRSDQTGAFVETQVYHIPYFGFTIVGLGSSGSGGARSFTF
jgi:hypothetical protein